MQFGRPATAKTTWIPAQFESTCEVCGDEVEPGDSIAFAEEDEAWVHGECLDAQG